MLCLLSSKRRHLDRLSCVLELHWHVGNILTTTCKLNFKKVGRHASLLAKIWWKIKERWASRSSNLWDQDSGFTRMHFPNDSIVFHCQMRELGNTIKTLDFISSSICEVQQSNIAINVPNRNEQMERARELMKLLLVPSQSRQATRDPR